MTRRILATLALAALVTAPAAAQPDPVMIDFNFRAPGENYWDSYEGNVSGGGAAGWFQIFCVDAQGQVNYPTDAYDAWATRMDATDQSRILDFAGTAWDQYLDAARLSTLMMGLGSFGGATAASFNLQTAIWYAMGYGQTNATWAANYAFYSDQVPNDVVINPTQWFVITSTGKDRQEFIAFLPDPPQELVPEPATMTLLATGLAGMAAARRRRKKS
jgi:hypothetical protein